ncbi:MAG TPA: hypothetical protein VEA37_03975 [Flavobacterium sp.]|nr:hypothetical protein [Flavobacterium sp.]
MNLIHNAHLMHILLFFFLLLPGCSKNECRRLERSLHVTGKNIHCLAGKVIEQCICGSQIVQPPVRATGKCMCLIGNQTYEIDMAMLAEFTATATIVFPFKIKQP